MSEDELVELAVDLMIEENGRKWFRELCESFDFLGKDLAFIGFKAGQSADSDIPTRKAFNAIRARC